MYKSLFTPPLAPPLIGAGNTEASNTPLIGAGNLGNLYSPPPGRRPIHLLFSPPPGRRPIHLLFSPPPGRRGQGWRRKLFFLLLPLLIACSTPSREELASLAAKGYYQHLIDGDYEHFLEGREFSDSLPDDYRSQLIDSYAQFLAQQQAARGGIREVNISRAFTDSTQNYTSVLLTLSYGDSTTEEVVVPMVERDGRWMMK